MIENGFTVEITGNIDLGISYSKREGIYENAGLHMAGLFFYGNHRKEQFSDFRFYSLDPSNKIYWSLNGGTRGEGSSSEFSEPAFRHNVVYPFGFSEIGEKVSDFVITLDPKIVKECDHEEGKLADGSTFVKAGTYIKASLWSEGRLLLTSDYAMAQWDTFTNKTINDCNEFVIGYTYVGYAWGTGPGFSTMKLESLRIYKRALKEDEIAKNWMIDRTYKKIINVGN